MLSLNAAPLFRSTTRPAQGRKSTRTVCEARGAKPSASRRETLLVRLPSQDKFITGAFRRADRNLTRADVR